MTNLTPDSVAGFPPVTRRGARSKPPHAAGSPSPVPGEGSPLKGGTSPGRGRATVPATAAPYADGAAVAGQNRQGAASSASSAVPAGSSAQYAAARKKALATQARRRPADPQRNQPYTDPRAAVAEMMRPCTCTHPELNHWKTDAGRVTWCSIATAAGPCGCEKYQPQGGGA
jgi:hypothetical protein